jgi:hypothetical protein
MIFSKRIMERELRGNAEGQALDFLVFSNQPLQAWGVH